MVTKAKKALLASLAAFLCVMLTVFGLSMSVSLSETAKAADETAVNAINLDAFVKNLENAGYKYDGKGVTVKWSPVSGCYDTREGHDCTVNNVKATANTPKRVNSGLTQFQLFEDKGVDVTVKNVNFVYEPAAFTICANSGWKGSFTAEQAPAGQLYFMTTGSVAFEGCTFDKTVLTTFNTTSTSSVKKCTFKNVYNSYAVKDIRGENVAVESCTFENCGAAIMVSSTGKVQNVSLTDNTFKEVDVAGTAPAAKVGTRGLIQIAEKGDYSAATISASGNTATNCGPVVRQLNDTVKVDETLKSDLKKLSTNCSSLYTSDSKKYVVKVGNTEYNTLDAAFAALSSKNYTLTLLDESVWYTAKPVYWKAGTQSGYVAKLTDALTAAYKANAGDIVIVCRPGADVGTMTHGHVTDNLTIYGNNAYISGGECDLEVDKFKFSRTTGTQANDGAYLEKNITINAYELDNLGVWGERHTAYTVNVKLTDCDGKEIAGNNNVQRVYISGTAGVNNFTITDCDFKTKATSIYSNANGKIVVSNCTFTGAQAPLNINHKADGAVTLEVTNSTFTSCGDNGDWAQFAAPARFVNSGSGTMTVTANKLTFDGTVGKNGDILLGDGRKNQKSNEVTLTVTNTAANIQAQKPGYYNDDGTTNETKVGKEAITSSSTEYTTSIEDLAPEKGSEKNPYTLEELGAMTRAEYIAAQEKLGGTMYVTVGNYSYDKNGVLGNGVRNNTPGQTPDHSKLNAYGENGYLGAKNDGANGKNVVFVGGSITSGATGYTSIDNIGTSLLLAVPAYTNVTFSGTTFNNVMSFDYQLYTSPWSQLGELKFDGCTFNGLIVGAIASQTLTFNGCTFTNYTNTTSANNSNPTWIRPAYGDWTQGDNKGQGDDFKSLTTINFTGNTVTSTRPVKFERIAQWEMATTVTAANNEFTISAQDGDTSTKNVGLYLGANAKFDLKVENNTKLGSTAALYTAVYSAPSGVSYAGLPAGSTVTDTKGNGVTVKDANEWKTTTKLTLETTKEVASVTNAKGVTVNFATLQAAFDAAASKATVKLLADTKENVVVDKVYELTFDLNGFTLNGGTEKGKPALTLNNRRLIIKDSSAAQTGTIMREDTAENSGVSSHYVIDIQGDNAFLKFESGNVKNNSGVGVKGASLVRVGKDSYKSAKPTLTIAGGTFTQDNFIVIKVDHGAFYLTGGELNSKNSYAIENWLNATVKGGTVNGTVSSWTYSDGSNSTLTISGGTINGNVESVTYDEAAGKLAKVSITGGTVTGTLSNKVYSKPGDADKAMATIEVSGGTFSIDPSKYVVEESAITENADGTFGVEKAYLVKVGDTSYYTMDEAFKAQTASGEAIVLLRDYTTVSTFNSGSKHRVVDLNGHTWTYTGTDMNNAAFEINHPNASLTVKNGTIISNSLVGLIPSVEGGTTKYDNAGLVFEKVEMTSNGSSGIETNGTNTNDSVTLINSTLNVPNGFGIYFPSSGTLTINNSTINAKTMGVQVCSGKLNINAGSVITVTGDAVPKTENDGAIQDGAAISIVNRTGYKGLSNIVITGGTFTAKAGNDAIKAYDWNNAENKGSDFTKADLVAVSGGTFSSEVEKDYLANGFRLTKTGESYGVTAKYIESTHVSLGTALSFSYKLRVLNEGETIKNAKALYRTVRGNLVEINMTLDDNGYYVFDGITPQMLDRKISVNVYIGDTVVYDVVDYSILDYLQDLLKTDLGTKATVTKQLVADLAFYGKAAMKYVGYTTTVVDKFIADNGLNQSTGDITGVAISSGTEKVANVSVQFASQNKILIGVAESVINDHSYTIKVNGTEIDKALWQTDVVDGYRVYVSDGFAASHITDENHYVEVEVLKNGASVQNVKCNVAGYCMKMAENAKMSELAKATYYYGVSAAEYANFKG